eukprot:GFKZ01006763.1.p2 GENE.GFKZ01006763.1~~GFKZ01006763.1.p2  ORF type:complete len:174 (-),score=19.86 GFKZ01006763.1:177-698(-)
MPGPDQREAKAFRAKGHSLIDLTATLIDILGQGVDLNSNRAVDNLYTKYSEQNVLKVMFASLKSSKAAKNMLKFVHKIVTEDDPAAKDTSADAVSPYLAAAKRPAQPVVHLPVLGHAPKTPKPQKPRSPADRPPHPAQHQPRRLPPRQPRPQAICEGHHTERQASLSQRTIST